MQFRCLVVDDNQRFLDVARRSLEWQGLESVGTAETIETALAATEADHPDVVLVDVSLGGESGFELVRLLAARFPELTGRIIMISTRAEEDYAELMEGTPAAGFLAKSALSVRAIRELIPDLP
ncbi:response regulator transcription factor [Actinoplanes sp. Pm04-4]|uniref:Response regulator transcription factor n=1 Tax=Paractinoplanes pyxinae TaxID=2997416 RepID=A0ABT4ASC4_9ACTN|nr:response regulator transcription factor [Actinoplanes pyxinae]MCY1137136.1 response regulator transcription factor [Actinoplanes pyxinae]